MTDPFYSQRAKEIRESVYKSPAVVVIIYNQYGTPTVVTSVDNDLVSDYDEVQLDRFQNVILNASPYLEGRD